MFCPPPRRVASRKLYMTVIAAVSFLVCSVSSAVAVPEGEFTVFANCPVSNPGLQACFVQRITSGEITIGRQQLPLTNTLLIEGGLSHENGTGIQQLLGAVDGDTLSRAPQKVPGGLNGLLKCDEISSSIDRLACTSTLANGTTAVNAIAEIAGPTSSIELDRENLQLEKGVGLTLPLKVKLENPFLGNACYIGSNANPIMLHLTNGSTNPPPPNKPIKGKFGAEASRGKGEILVIAGDSLIDNAFNAPQATGCGANQSFLIDPIIDTKIGLPSTTGRNTAILNSTIEQAGHNAIEEHDG